MKTSGANPWKLGLFVVVGLSACVAGLWWLGLQHFDRETFEAVTYFDESVNGLDLGAPVKMRGVRIGNVSQITFAADQQTVEVRARISRDVLRGLGLDSSEDGLPDTGGMIERGMRMQLAVTGLTGVRFLLVDYFDPERFTIPELPFEPPINYIPAAPSTLKSLEEGFFVLLDRLPPIAVEVQTLARQLNEKLAELDLAGLAGRTESLLARLETLLDEADLAALFADGGQALGEIRAAAGDARALFTRLAAQEGPVERAAGSLERVATRLETQLAEARIDETAASLRGAADSMGSLSREVGGVSGDLRVGLVALGEALQALRALAEYLERDPAALLRGGAR